MGRGGEHYIYIYMCYHTHIYLYICIWIVGHTLMFLESKSTMVPTSKNPLSNPQGKCFSRVAGKLGGVAELDSHFERDVLPTKPTSVAAVSCCQSLRWIFGTTSEFASPPSHTHTHTPGRSRLAVKLRRILQVACPNACGSWWRTESNRNSFKGQLRVSLLFESKFNIELILYEELRSSPNGSCLQAHLLLQLKKSGCKHSQTDFIKSAGATL